MIAHLAVALLAGFQDTAIPPTPFARVIELEITADDPVLIDGRGPAVVFEYQVQFDGTLHVWTRSELDHFLRVEEDSFDPPLASEDDNSGGGDTPYVKLPVEAGTLLLITVGSEEPRRPGTLELHLVAAPESEVTLEAARAGQAALAEAHRLRGEGDLDAARVLVEDAVGELLTVKGGKHSEAVAAVQWSLGFLAMEMSSVRTVGRAWTAARDHRERTLPEDHRDLLIAGSALAETTRQMGDLAGARALYEVVLPAFERALPPDHPNLLAVRQNLAFTLIQMGAYADARALLEGVLASYERTVPADHPDLLTARLSLATILFQVGDLAGARAIQEAVLAGLERTLPEGSPDLLWASSDLAITLGQMGDLAGARALKEAVLAARERRLPEDHYDLLNARANLAATLMQMGDHDGALALYEAVFAGFERTMPADHPDLLAAETNLAVMMQRTGDLDGAHSLYETILAGYERTLPEDHLDPLRVRGNLVGTMREMGDLESARALGESTLAIYERNLPDDNADLLRTRTNLAYTVWEMGDPVAAHALAASQIAGMRTRVLGSLAFAPRQARGAVAGEAPRMSQVLFLSRSADVNLRNSVFELQETMRMVVGEAARAIEVSRDPQVEALMNETRSVRAALNDLVSGSTPPEELSAELTRLMQTRDRLEREASRRLVERGVVTGPIEIGPLADALGGDAAAVGYARVTHRYTNGETGRVQGGPDHLLAHVLLPDDSLTRIDLGEASELEQLVSAWSPSLDSPNLRGIAMADEHEANLEGVSGEELRAQLLDPILAVLGEETRRLHVCADDIVFLVPLDALPFEDGRVGDRWSVVNEVSFARLLTGDSPLESEASLLALGGVDYEGDAPAGNPRSSGHSFARLPHTVSEVETTGVLFEELLEAEPVVLTHRSTTKTALFEHARGKRYLHLATHGWFAPESMGSTMDAGSGNSPGSSWDLEERVRGMAPMLLCGLALAGANQGRDSLGRLNGILTAEELCSLDLSACDLAVLSACETNVGIRRAGQGIQSLQAALYAAGGRSSITSLWKVDDAATRQLMEHFYSNLWAEKMPKAAALWEAKKVLREEGAPVRDWAAWVLTGDPH